MTNGSEEDAEGITPAKMAKYFVEFDFGNTWALDKNSPFPYPQLKRCMQVRTESIELVSLPDKLSYTEREQLDLSGSKLKVTIKAGSLKKTIKVTAVKK